MTSTDAYDVQGRTCEHCVSAVSAELAKLTRGPAMRLAGSIRSASTQSRSGVAGDVEGEQPPGPSVGAASFVQNEEACEREDSGRS